MTPEDRERLIVDMLAWSQDWEDDAYRPEFSQSVAQRLATLTPEEYGSVWAGFYAREAEDMEEESQPVDDDPSPVGELIRDLVHFRLWSSGDAPDFDAQLASLNARLDAYAGPVRDYISAEVERLLVSRNLPMVWQHNSSTPTEDLQRAREEAESQLGAVGMLQPMAFPTSVRPYVTLTTETEIILGRLLNPTTTLERLCVAALRGDAVALAALEDGIKQGELTL